tara:strand:- start:762 stop:1208 length:447 start_codon:yes stop_codon:yes gene_type:complete
VKVEDLIEIEKIRQLKARYFRSMDQKNWDEWEQVFTEDAVFDFSAEGTPPIHGRSTFREYLLPILENVKTVHHGHMSEIKIDGDIAFGIWSMEDMLWWPKDQGGTYLWGMGWYYEKYKKCNDGRWCIAELTLKRIKVVVDGIQTYPPV